jgi:ABC-type transport system involved in multi-copper enzyme maturation permease subunit
VNGFADFAFGPLAGLEIHRSLSRRWVRIGQVLAALPGVFIALIVLWWWWFSRQIDPNFLPRGTLTFGVIALGGMMLVVALVMSPAVVAGTLAGEKARGVLPLLLASSVTTREIVTGRLAGRLSVVGLFVLASLPAVCLLAGLASLPITAVLMLFALPVAVGFGTGGMAILASATSRRARDALLAVYLFELLLFLLPVLGAQFLPPSVWDFLGPINPFYGLGSLVETAELLPAANTCTIWLTIGFIGLGLASWRLRRVYLRQVDDNRPRGGRRQRVRPPVGDDPMLWKEINFERAERFSLIVWWVGAVIFSALLGTAVVMVGIVVWSQWIRPDVSLAQWATAQLQTWAGGSAIPVSWLIQWTIALRAAVAIASEREHATWDTLLLTELDGREIVRAKIWGNLYSLRGFIAAASIIWTLAALVGALELWAYWTSIANTVVISIFITAAGVWISLASSTATRAMTWTIGIWLLAGASFAFVALIVVGVIALVIVIGWMYWIFLSRGAFVPSATTGGPPIPISFETGWALTRLLLYFAAAFLIALHCRMRFDRLAGRAA